MPELPEVETVKRALEPVLVGAKISNIKTHINKLRSPLDIEFNLEILNQKITILERRSKYIIIKLKNKAGLIIHLGMTGSFRFEHTSIDRKKHDHVEFFLDSGLVLRYNDPRRFGQIVAFSPTQILDRHKLLLHLGPEPLTASFNVDYLFNRLKKRVIAIKKLIMDNNIVVGVGNIYASESLFRAGISPLSSSGKISKPRIKKLVSSIKEVLNDAIQAGGTTIRDYSSLNGEEGYFVQDLNVYGREGEKCYKCRRSTIRKVVQGGRSTYFCPVCQR